MPNRSASTNAGRMPSDRLARKTSAEADSVAPRQSDMMLPVSVMKVIPTATQPMNEMALSRALKLICEVKPGVVSANTAIAAMVTALMPNTMRPRPAPLRKIQTRSLSSRAAGFAFSAPSLMPPQPGE